MLQALRQIAAKHTVVVVTHSLRVASQAQQIYHVQGDGQVEHGTPERMLPKLFGVGRASGPDQHQPQAAPAANQPTVSNNDERGALAQEATP
ncbi:hypothetical protein D3C71_2067260 [compost metagenome]